MGISRSTMLVYLPMWSHHGKAVVHFNIEEGTSVAYFRFVAIFVSVVVSYPNLIFVRVA